MHLKFNPKLLLTAFSLFAVPAISQQLPSPKSHFGFEIGDDYQLANFTQTEAYFKKLADASDRIELTSIGLTEEGRNQYMMIVSSPENLKNLAKYKEISQKMARAEGIGPEDARKLAGEGKAVVWIDGGLHATETVGIHQLIETAWQLADRNDAETHRILDKTIILLTHANPDGQELVSNWYMRNSDPKKRSLEFLPRLYQKYIGHDNNRDFYMMQMKESRNMGRQLFVEWMPQIMYNHHQRGPAGSVLAGPPYRDPFNYVFDPLLITGIDALGAAMYNRLNAENKPGFTRLTGSTFSTWYNGGLRTTTQFHNVIGLLTEIIGNPTPEEIPLVPNRLIPNGATPNPVTPQKWHFRQSIDYSISLNWSVLDYAARHSDELLYNIYHMGKNSIDRGNSDYWTAYPKRIEAISELMKSARPTATASTESGPAPKVNYYDMVFKDSTLRDARGYIIPADQPDFATAVTFLNALIRSGIQVEKATAAFSVAGKRYPRGSYIVKTAQAFRPHILDMFEPQDHPNDFQYAGGPPIRPYDAAGWTLAFQMGVRFDRVLNGFTGPFEKIPYGELQNLKTEIPKAAKGYLLSASENNAFLAVNKLLAAGADVYRVTAGPDLGKFYVPASAKAKSAITALGDSTRIAVAAAGKRPAATTRLRAARVALWDNFGGSMPSGWLRWLTEQFGFPVTRVFAADIDAGELRKKYDVVLFVSRAIPAKGNERGPGRIGPKPEDIPAEYHGQLGSLTAGKSVPALKAFLEAGGKVITIGSSTALAYHLNLPVRNALVEMTTTGERPLPGEKYYVPGSILQVSVDSTLQSGWGMPAKADVYFDDSPVFNIAPEAIAKGAVKPLLWFSADKPLRSGWAWGQSYLRNGVTAFEAAVGSGKLLAFGPEITFRAQSYGTFKFLFNEMYVFEP
ncbi:peptidase [Dyadobacter beijingensis]|uniref:Peptidase n=1 Tax=Dyadobacter beijingensis TaxID=365489 RepID=A0ABQ2I2G3_9BACT|nr:M14 metallopeptidase family protein [Dyadobacter beijingensis]GGM96250.1 peptidase [Dyadobacter beijingensis]